MTNVRANIGRYVVEDTAPRDWITKYNDTVDMLNRQKMTTAERGTHIEIAVAVRNREEAHHEEGLLIKRDELCRKMRSDIEVELKLDTYEQGVRDWIWADAWEYAEIKRKQHDANNSQYPYNNLVVLGMVTDRIEKLAEVFAKAKVTEQ